MRDNYKIDEKSVEISKRETLKRILSYFSNYRLRIALIIIMVLAMSFIVSSIPLFTQHAVDVDIHNRDVKGLAITVSIAIALCVVIWILSVIKQHMLASITNEIVWSVRKDCYDKVLKLSLNFFDTRPSGRILARLVGDMEGFKTISQQMVNDLIPNIAIIIIVFTIMLISSPILSISAFVVLPFLSASTFFIIYKGYPNWESYRKKESNHTAFVFEDYSGIRAIQSFSAEGESIAEEKRLLKEVTTGWNKAVRFSDSLNVVMLTNQGFGYFLLFVFAVKWLKMGSSSVGQLLAFSGYMTLFWQPVRALASMYTQMINNLASASRVFELMDEEVTLTEDEDAKPLVVTDGNVEFDNISFAYPDEPDVTILEDVSFKVKGGSRIALVGPTGAGKTTIINLIARFYDPIKGRVLIDGEDIAHVTFSSLRDSITLMPQDSMLFTGTIKDNLLYRRECSDEEMIAVCKRLGIDSFISNLSEGYNTEIGDALLSQGQSQLIALARTIIADPKILILDEATSNVDTQTELMVQRGLDILMEGRTSFVVAHRLSTIVSSDEIFVISDKGILERGNHKELMAKDGEYKKLYMAQFAFM